MRRLMKKHKPLLAACLAIAMLTLSAAIMFSGQDWMTIEDPDLRLEVAYQMNQYRKILDEYDNPEGMEKLDGASAFIEKFGAKVDMRDIFRKAQFVCSELESGGISVMKLRGFLEIGQAIDEVVTKNVPLEDISFLVDAFGFDEASMWIDRLSAILAKTQTALLAYNILYWAVIVLFAFSVLLMFLDTRIGPTLFVLVNVLSCVGVLAVSIYIKRKTGLGFTLAAPAIVSVSLSLGALVLWYALGIANRRKLKKSRIKASALDEEV